MMNQSDIIQKTADFAQETLTADSSGHDWWHVHRVWQNAKYIGQHEAEVNMFVLELAALLHDIADHKFHDGDYTVKRTVSKEWLTKLQIEDAIITRILDCIHECSFSSGNRATSPEAKILQDADRLDALGATGIARTFATGATFDQPLYDPTQPKETQKTSIGHFYTKLLKLKDQMNTTTGKELAEDRHQYIEKFLERFYQEWKGTTNH